MTRAPKKIRDLNIERPYLVEVWWIDACSDARWLTKEEVVEFANNSTRPQRNAGWLIHQDKDNIIIASRRADTEEGKLQAVGHVQWIPWPWITKLRRLKES